MRSGRRPPCDTESNAFLTSRKAPHSGLKLSFTSKTIEFRRVMFSEQPSTGTKARWMGLISSRDVILAASSPKKARAKTEETVMGLKSPAFEGCEVFGRSAVRAALKRRGILEVRRIRLKSKVSWRSSGNKSE